MLTPTCNVTSSTMLACAAPGENTVDMPCRNVPEGAVMAVMMLL